MASAAISPFVSVEEYLHTMYRPDVDYVDGYLEERNLGEYDHATLQITLSAFFHSKRHEWKIRVAPQLRVQTGERRFRIPDVCIMSTANPKEQIIRHAPILCIEVLSPEDSMKRMRVRLEDFFRMGVPEVWIFDPATRVVTVCRAEETSEHRAGTLALRESPISIEMASVFSALDED